MERSCSPQTGGLPQEFDRKDYDGKRQFIKRFSGEIFTLGTFDDMIRIQIGQCDPRDLRPCRCFGLRHQGLPLIDESVWNDGSIAPVAYQNFRWCGIRSNVIKFHLLVVAGVQVHCFLIRLNAWA